MRWPNNFYDLTPQALRHACDGSWSLGVCGMCQILSCHLMTDWLLDASFKVLGYSFVIYQLDDILSLSSQSRKWGKLDYSFPYRILGGSKKNPKGLWTPENVIAKTGIIITSMLKLVQKEELKKKKEPMEVCGSLSWGPSSVLSNLLQNISPQILTLVCRGNVTLSPSGAQLPIPTQLPLSGWHPPPGAFHLQMSCCFHQQTLHA